MSRATSNLHAKTEQLKWLDTLYKVFKQWKGNAFDAISVHSGNGEYNVEEEVHGNNQARQNEDQLQELSRP